MENNIKKEYLHSYGIYDWSAFSRCAIDKFGFFISDAIFDAIKKVEDFLVGRKESISYHYNISFVGDFITYYEDFEAARDKYDMGRRNLFDDIKSFFGEKFGIYDFSDTKALPSYINEHLSKINEYDVSPIIFENYSTAPTLSMKLYSSFNYIIQGDSLPKAYFDKRRFAIIIVYDDTYAEELSDKESGWKEIINTYFKSDEKVEFREDSHNVIEFIMPLTNFMDNPPHQKDTIEIYLNGKYLRCCLDDADYARNVIIYNTYKGQFCSLFYTITGLTTYEWVLRGLQHNMFIDYDPNLTRTTLEPSDIIKKIEPELKIWHRRILDM